MNYIILAAIVLDSGLAFLQNNLSHVETKQYIPWASLILQNGTTLVYSPGSQAPYNAYLSCYSCIQNDYIYCVYGQEH